MANSSWIVPAAVAVVTPLIMAAFNKRSAVTVQADASGMRTLRLPKAFGILGWVAMGMSLLFVAATVGLALKGELLSLLGLVFSSAFVWMSLALILGGRNHSVSFDQEWLIVTDARARTEEYAWKSITSGRVHPLSKMIVLRTDDGRRLRINPYLIGSDTLFHMMAERTQLPVAELVAKARTVG